MAVSQYACEAIWMRKILVGLFSSHLYSTIIHCDNQSCIKLSINPMFHDRSKNIYIYIYPISLSQRLCAVEYHVASIDFYERSRCRHSDEGAH